MTGRFYIRFAATSSDPTAGLAKGLVFEVDGVETPDALAARLRNDGLVSGTRVMVTGRQGEPRRVLARTPLVLGVIGVISIEPYTHPLVEAGR